METSRRCGRAGGGGSASLLFSWPWPPLQGITLHRRRRPGERRADRRWRAWYAARARADQAHPVSASGWPASRARRSTTTSARYEGRWPPIAGAGAGAPALTDDGPDRPRPPPARGGPGRPPLDESRSRAYALVREAARRALACGPSTCRWWPRLALHRGAVVEMQTGEGKTLAAVCPPTSTRSPAAASTS